jgi:exopolysaccharide production protein ExoY
VGRRPVFGEILDASGEWFAGQARSVGVLTNLIRRGARVCHEFSIRNRPELLQRQSSASVAAIRASERAFFVSFQSMLKPNEASSFSIGYPVRETRQDAAVVAVPEPLPSWKRILDLICVLLALPLLLPMGVLIAIFIKLVSPGPAFFRQQRVGLLGKKFMCLKFRTMRVNADTAVHQAHLKRLMTSNHPTRKLDCAGDKRLIFGGLILRSLGVDELPQLINVLRGDMSLVGPRPCTPYEYELYLPRHKRRCEVQPGLTGLWQVSGKNHTTFEEQIDLDLYYVDHKSLWFDLKIMALTLPAILALVWEMKSRSLKVIPFPGGKPPTKPGKG